jgi:hypothetical protein
LSITSYRFWFVPFLTFLFLPGNPDSKAPRFPGPALAFLRLRNARGKQECPGQKIVVPSAETWPLEGSEASSEESNHAMAGIKGGGQLRALRRERAKRTFGFGLPPPRGRSSGPQWLGENRKPRKEPQDTVPVVSRLGGLRAIFERGFRSWRGKATRECGVVSLLDLLGSGTRVLPLLLADPSGGVGCSCLPD